MANIPKEVTVKVRIDTQKLGEDVDALIPEIQKLINTGLTADLATGLILSLLRNN